LQILKFSKLVVLPSRV